ncbi:MAG: hypothetical protein KAH31_06470 [Candidatus Sabulitectum sp.]|nr:hypothetical protein [Candidatus Sabulitectum sp.]
MKMIIGVLALSMLLFAACGAPEQEIQAETEETIPEGIVDLANTTCPVMGDAVMDGEYLDWQGYRIHFCCAGCDADFLADPQQYMKVLCEDPSVTVDLSAVLDCEGPDASGCCPGGDTEEIAGCPDCTEDEMCATCAEHMEAACPDCTDEEMCEECASQASDEPMACHAG